MSKKKYMSYTGVFLKIDLSTKSTSVYPINDSDRKLFIGGKMLAARILYDYIKAPIDPLGAENVIVVNNGPFTGAGCPCSSRFNISTVSPLTNILTSSNCGGNFGLGLKRAGYDGIIITGKCEELTLLEITEKGVTYKSAEKYRGKRTGETQELIGGNSSKLVIGPAGEAMVRFACTVSNDRAAGRGGTGAVFGSKNIKAITVSGYKKLEFFDEEALKEINQRWVKRLKTHPLTGSQLPKLGTSALLSTMQQRHILATKNFGDGQYDKFRDICGETMAEKYVVGHKGCTTCPIRCERLVTINGQVVKGPEVEIMGLMGGNILNNNLEKILEWNYLMDELGMDTISCSGTVAFAMELAEKKVVDLGLHFGEIDNISEVLEDIAFRRGVGDELAEGSRKLMQKYGGEEYCIQVKGMELSAYEPRGAVGQGLGYSISNRGGCHLNAGYMVIMEGLGLSINPYTAKGKAQLTVMFQDLMEAISACGSCLFTSYAFFPMFLFNKPNGIVTRIVNKVMPYLGGVIDIVNKFPQVFQINLPMMMLPYTLVLKAACGMRSNMGLFLRSGKRGYTLERLINTKLGISRKDDKLPDRLTAELQIKTNKDSKVPQAKLLEKYYRSRQWDKNGIPKQKLLKALKLDNLDDIGARAKEEEA